VFEVSVVKLIEAIIAWRHRGLSPHYPNIYGNWTIPDTWFQNLTRRIFEESRCRSV